MPIHENSATYQLTSDPCKLCPPGTYTEEGCLPDKPDTPSCIPCPNGTYRQEYNQANFCRPHKTICNAPYQKKKPVQPGNQTHDAVCDCKHGTIKMNNNKCVKTCPRGKGVTKVVPVKAGKLFNLGLGHLMSFLTTGQFLLGETTSLGHMLETGVSTRKFCNKFKN
ncbi:receptor super member 6b [Branchiostoma belcheri]|nr:receptor super member 6b [Branchiostoma belcheri]